jgi:hypothetical protein
MVGCRVPVETPQLDPPATHDAHPYNNFTLIRIFLVFNQCRIRAVIRAARTVGKVLWFLQCSQSRRRRARRCETHRGGLRLDARRSRVIYSLCAQSRQSKSPPCCPIASPVCLIKYSKYKAWIR